MSATRSQFHLGKDSLMRHPPRSYPGNKANLHRPVSVGLIPPLGYCIRSPTSTLIICTEAKVNWRMTDCADSTHHWTLNEWLRILSCVIVLKILTQVTLAFERKLSFLISIFTKYKTKRLHSVRQLLFIYHLPLQFVCVGTFISY